jgi:hypothetical protein
MNRALGCLAAAAMLWAAEVSPSEKYSERERKLWSLQPRAEVKPPAVPDVINPIDAFVREKLVAEGLTPAPAASRETLIRRVTFDLTGLPPSPEEVRAFVNDSSPRAYEALVDRLLASHACAEKWANHWLDVVRFAETDGFEYDTHRNDAWRYRDYVIDSFHEDKPFNQFVREQLAGDEMDRTNEEYRVAAGFQRLGALRKNAGN